MRAAAWSGFCSPVSECDHHRDVVRDDVVHFPRDPGALGGSGMVGLLPSFPLYSRGAIARVVAEHCGSGEGEGETHHVERDEQSQVIVQFRTDERLSKGRPEDDPEDQEGGWAPPEQWEHERQGQRRQCHAARTLGPGDAGSRLFRQQRSHRRLEQHRVLPDPG